MHDGNAALFGQKSGVTIARQIRKSNNTELLVHVAYVLLLYSCVNCNKKYSQLSRKRTPSEIGKSVR